MAKDQFIEQVLLPFYHNLIDLPGCFAIFDHVENLLVISNNLVKLFGLGDKVQFSQQLHSCLPAPLIAENHRLAQLVQHSETPLVTIYYLARTTSLLRLRVEPLFYPSGEYLGHKLLLQEFKFLMPMAIIPGVVARPFLYSHYIIEDRPLDKFSPNEHRLIFLLALQFTRHQIATLTGLHVSKLTRLINKIADKLNAKSTSQEHVLLAIFARGIHRFIPSEYAQIITNFSPHSEISPGVYRLTIPLNLDSSQPK